MTDQHGKFLRRRIIAVFFFLSGILTASWNVRIPDIQQKLALNDVRWGTVLSMLPAGLISGLFLSSWLVSRFGTDRVTFVTSVIACLLLPVIGIANLQGLLMLTLFFVGLNRTIMNVALNTSAIEVQSLYTSPIISTFHGLWSIACLAATGFGTLMIRGAVAPAYHFIGVAIISLPIVFICMQYKSATHGRSAERPFLVKPDRYLLLLGFIFFFSAAVENTMFDWSVNYFEKIVGARGGWRTAGFTCFILLMSLGRFAGNYLIGKFGAMRLLLFNSILMMAGVSLIVFLPFPIPASIGFLLIGVGDATVVPVVYTLAGKSTKPMAHSVAAVTSIGYLGFLLNPLIVGSVSQWLDMRWAFAIMFIFSGMIALLSTRIDLHRPRIDG